MTNTELLDELEDVVNKYVEVMIRVLKLQLDLTSEEKDRMVNICMNTTAKIADVFGADRADMEEGYEIVFGKIFDKNR